MRFARRQSLVVTLGLALAACGGGRHYWNAQPLAAQGIAIQPTSVFVRGPLLDVRTVFVNQTSAPVLVDRDAVVVLLPDGHAIRRASGMTTMHRPYIIPPGASHNVWVDFRSEGFDWSSVPGATVNWSGAVTINGAPIALPAMPLQQ